MHMGSAACATALLCAALAGCSDTQSAESTENPPRASSTGRAGTLSVTEFRFSGWHDETFHYLPALSVTAPAIGRPVFVQRVDFTAEDAGTRRLLKGVRYAAAPRVQPGGTVELVSQAEPAEITSPLAVAFISAIVFFTDDEGQTGIISTAASTPQVPDRASLASVEIRQFSVGRRQHQRRFLYWPSLTLVETSGRSRAAVKKIVFELLDGGAARRIVPVWNAPDVPARGTVRLVTGTNGQAPWFEIEGPGDAARMSVAISFVDDAGCGGLVTAIAPVDR
jgi:hypothetical protein